MRALRIVGALLLAAGAAFAKASAAASIDDLKWLAGCWAAEGAEPGSGEQWMAPAGATMLGVSRTVRAGRTVEWEFMQIREAASGRLVYTALPSGQRETSFELLRIGAAEVVFENPQHDFPQRVMYRLAAPGRLEARIEGQRNGQLRAVDFPLRSVGCE